MAVKKLAAEVSKITLRLYADHSSSQQTGKEWKESSSRVTPGPITMKSSRHSLLSSNKGETVHWLLSLLTQPIQDQPLSLVIGLIATTWVLSTSIASFVLGPAQPSSCKAVAHVSGGAWVAPQALASFTAGSGKG